MARTNIQDVITRPKIDITNQKVGKSRQVSYNINGESDVKSKTKFLDSESCATEITSGKTKIYKVKTKNGGYLFNPLEVSFNYGLDRLDKLKSQPMFRFTEVNEQAFRNYVQFLQKRHDALLRAAQREI